MEPEVGRKVLICAENTDAASNACRWFVDEMYREGDVVHLVYVARALKPPIEVFHGMPGTAYTFSQPGQHHEVVDIETARRTILHRFLPILQKKNIKYELHLYAENAEASSSKVAEAIIRAGAEDVQPDLVVLAAHNKPATDKYMGALGGVTRQLISSCTLPLVIIHPEVTA